MTAAVDPTLIRLDPYAFVRRTLFVDAATCVAMGLALVLLAQPLASYLGLGASLLEYSGASLLPIAAFMAWVATREAPGATPALRGLGVWLVIAGNVAWIAASIALLVLAAPTALGYAFVIAQAVVVAVLVELEYYGVRRGDGPNSSRED